MKPTHAIPISVFMLANISFAQCAMENKNWICGNGPRTIALMFDKKDEDTTFHICSDKECKHFESNGRAKLASSVGSHYFYNIADGKSERCLTIYFSENAIKGIVPNADPAENSAKS